MGSISRVSGLILISIALDTVSLGGTLTLTPEGIADGFHLTSFVTDFPGPSFSRFGPFGIAVASDGHVIVSSFFDGRNYVLADVDGQSIADAINSAPFPIFGPSFAVSGGVVWGTVGSGANPTSLFKLSNDGAIDTAYSVPGLELTSGLWTDPANGHLIAAGEIFDPANLFDVFSNDLFDVDVSGATPAFRVIPADAKSLHGWIPVRVTTSLDGTTAYTTYNSGVFPPPFSSAVVGFSIATGALTFGPVPLVGAGGLGILSGNNAFKGNIIVTTIFGDVVMIDAATGAQTLIASGGTEGGFVAPDPTNGSLFLTQSREVFRLECGPGCGSGGPPPAPPGVPEPASIACVAGGLALVFAFNRTKRLWFLVFPLAFYALAGTKLVSAQSGPLTYAITDLGTLPSLGDQDSNALAINSSGTVAGVSGTYNQRIQDISPSHASVWVPASPNSPSGRMSDLGGPTGFICGSQRLDTFARSINDSNQIVGSATIATNGACTDFAFPAVLYSRGAVTDLVGLGPNASNAATGINNAGTVVGTALISGVSNVWLYNGTIHNLQSLPGFSISQLAVINSSGQIAGWGNSSDFLRGRAFLHTGLGPLAASDTLPTLGGSNATASGINDDGSVVGNSELSNGVVHAYLFANGRMTDLGSLIGPSGNSGASAINSAGDVVGGSGTDGSDFHAVLWKNGASIVDLNMLIDSKLGWVLTFANGINTFGQIVGQGTIGGHRHAFLLTPTTGLVSFTLKSTSICGTAQTTGTVTLASPAPGGGTAVTILSAHPSIADGPAIVTVPSGQTTASFPITSHQVPDSVNVTFQVLLNGQTLSATLAVKLLLAGIAFAPGEICSLSKTTATVQLACPAPSDEIIGLSSKDPQYALVPGNVVVAKGQTSASFVITGSDVPGDHPAPNPDPGHTFACNNSGLTDVCITATLDIEKKSEVLTVHPILGNLAIKPATVAGAGAATGTVSLTTGQACAAPKGGLSVTLVSDDVDVARPSVPIITIAAGAHIGTFRISTTVPTKASCTEAPPSTDGSCTVNIAAHAAGSTQTASIKVTQPGKTAVDVTQLVSVIAGGFRLDRASGLYLQQVMVVNQSTSLESIPGPISLVLDYFHPNDTDPDSWSLAGAADAGSGQSLQTGKTTVLPLGRPYVRLSLDRLPAPGVLNPGDVVTINLSYRNPQNTPITWVPVVLQGF